MTVLLIAEHDNHHIKPSSRNLITAALQIGGDIHVLVAGHGCGEAAREAATLPDVSKVLLCDCPALADESPENLAPLVASLGGQYSHLLAAASSSGRNWMPRVAALLDEPQVSDVVRIEGPDSFVRPIYAGSLLATVQTLGQVKVLTVRVTAFEARAGDSGGVPVVALEGVADAGLARRDGLELNTSPRPELGTAKVVVSGGRGLGSGEAYQRLLEPLADKLKAALGASRAAVDLGYVPNDFQVGQTGKIVAPELYIAVGISGAIQHLAGMKESKVIVAINKDPDAPIFSVADYGLVGDLNQIVPELTAAL